MAQVIDELVTILGFDMDSRAGRTLDKFNKGIESVTKYARLASLAITAASVSISYFVLQANKASDTIEKLGRVTGISTNTIQEMSFALEQVGGSAATMHSDLESLMMSMNSPIPGEFNQGLFLLGISTKKASGELKSVDEVLLNIADKMQGMSKQKQMQWGQKIGISKDTIMLLQEGRGEIERLRKQAKQMPVIIDPESLKNAREFNRQISLLSRVFGFLGQTIASAAGPALKEFTTNFIAWVTLNKELIQSGLVAFIEGVAGGFARFADVISVVYAAVSELIPGLDGFTEALTATEVISGVVLGILVAMSIPLAILLAKFLLVAAAVTAVGLIFEDFVVYLRGGNSVIGELIKKVTEMWEVFGQKFPAMADFLEEFWGVLKTFASFLKDVFFYVLDRFIDLLGLVAKGWGLLAGLAEKGLKKLGFGDEENVLEVKVREVTEIVKSSIDVGQEKVQEIIEPVREPAGLIVDKMFGKIQEAVEQTQVPALAVQEATKEVTKPVREPITTIKEAIAEPIKAAQAPITRVQKVIEKLVEPVRKTIKEPVKIIQEVIKPVRKTIKEVVKPITRIQEVIKEVIKPVRETIKEVVKPVKKPIKKPITRVQEVIKEVIKPVRETITRAQKTIKEVTKPVREPIAKVQEVIQSVKKPITRVQEAIKEVIKPTRETVNDTSGVGGIIGDFGARVQEADNAISGLIQMVTGSIGLVKELSGLNFKDTNSLMSSPITATQQNNTTPVEQNISNTVRIDIVGDNAPAVASEVSSKLRTTLYQIYPGGLAPAVQ